MVSIALVLFGVLGFRELSVREFPDVDPPIVSVSTTLRGANPRVMESAVTDVLEEELATLEGLRTMTSTSGEQSSNITLEFNLDRDIESAAQDVRDKVSRIRGRLPEVVEEPVISRCALHAWTLGFAHPTTGKLVHFEAPLATDMQTLLEMLRQYRKV